MQVQGKLHAFVYILKFINPSTSTPLKSSYRTTIARYNLCGTYLFATLLVSLLREVFELVKTIYKIYSQIIIVRSGSDTVLI